MYIHLLIHTHKRTEIRREEELFKNQQQREAARSVWSRERERERERGGVVMSNPLASLGKAMEVRTKRIYMREESESMCE